MKVFSKFIGLSIYNNQDPDDSFCENEDLIFYLGVLNFMNNLNLGTKIENLDVSDQYYVAFVKVIDTLRYIFDSLRI